MADFVDIPVSRVAPDTLLALLEEYATRDGTDYGERETQLEERVASLRKQLDEGAIRLLFDADSETWDILPVDAAQAILD
ncbi:MAG: YheU family protein [Pseudomonadota bacterium]